MTRINVVPPAELSRQHLVAEYRELPRLFKLIKAACDRGEKPDDPRNPKEYCLGKGHVRFFYDKVWWLGCRFHSLVEEMRARGYQPSFTSLPSVAYDIPLNRLLDEYKPSDTDLALNRQRIKERS